jgi:hypothetical protein
MGSVEQFHPKIAFEFLDLLRGGGLTDPILSCGAADASGMSNVPEELEPSQIH